MKKHILYSFRRCPYAIRARWSLIKSHININIREVDLKNKPQDILKKSRSQTVPLLLLDNGEVIDQSLDIILWALSHNKKGNLYYKEDQRVSIRKLIKENDESFKFHLDRFKYSSRYKDGLEDYHFSESQKIIINWNNLLKESKDGLYWLINGEETIADWCIFPFVRQYKLACFQKKISNYFLEPISSWLNYFENHPSFKKIMIKHPIWLETK